MADKLENTIETLMKSIDQHISTKTVLGEPVVSNGVTVFPLADVTFGMAAGSFNKDKNDKGAGGVGAKVSPAALLIIQNGSSRIVSVKDTDSINKLINMIPDLVDRISGLFSKSREESKKDSKTDKNKEE